ncbi:MAG TPA: ABC transporter ATP-binding protein [Anaerolineae bacterium]|nr:ABC transporter ATP-binding protein [Anaerolineae bacterium]HQI87707.1 ABC transporter ATP-binding protein [Anaerolineae bacterium]
MTDAAIRCEGLTRHYGDVIALQDLNLAVPYGSIFGFLGRNGAGKTTTMRLLVGLGHPTAGRAWIDGVETTNGDSRAREKFGYLPQDPAFYSWMTPREYLDYAGRLFGMSAADRKSRIEEMLELVGLKDAARRKIGGFSGGMHQRMGIAQALLHRPPVLLLDEPTSALDPAGRYEVLDLLDKLRGAVTVFFSTHILADVERICDTIAIIHKGQLLLVAGRDELRERYPLNTAVLELDAASLPWTEAFIALLKTQPWITGVTQEESVLRIVVNDVAHGKQALLPLVLQQGVILTRYEWVRPTLEEIFLKVSA